MIDVGTVYSGSIPRVDDCLVPSQPRLLHISDEMKSPPPVKQSNCSKDENESASSAAHEQLAESFSKVAVTGANGFIGSNLLPALVDLGVEVRAIVRSGRRPQGLEAPVASKIQVCETDLRSTGELQRALAGVDCIIHLAGRTSARKYRDLLEVNRAGTLSLFKAIGKRTTPPKVVVVSSLAAAGPSRPLHPLVENQEPRPISMYGRSKLASEQMAFRFSKEIPVTILRPGIVFGPLDRAVFALMRSVDRFRAMPIAGYHRPKFSFVHVDDLNDAILRAAAFGTHLPSEPRQQPGRGIYFVADPQPCTFSEFGSWIAKGLGRRRYIDLLFPLWMIGSLAWLNEHASAWMGVPETFNVDKIREAAGDGWECDVSAAIDELNWSPIVSLEERIRQTIAWYRSQRWLR